MPNDFHSAEGTRPSKLPHGPDAHGRAALLLVESLIHGLIARSALTVANAIEIIEVAVDVEAELALVAGMKFETPSLLTPLADTLLGSRRP